MNIAASQRIFSAKAVSRQRVRPKGESSSLWGAIKVIAVILLITLFYLWSRLEAVSIGYDIARENRERDELIYENKRLKLEILSLKSPGRIEAIAFNELGLVYPKGEQVITVK